MKSTSFSGEFHGWSKVSLVSLKYFKTLPNNIDENMWKIDGNTIVSKFNQTLGFHATDGLIAFVQNNPIIESLYIEKIEPTSNYKVVPGW